MQVSVTLPPGLVEGLVDNHYLATGKTTSFAEIARIAIFDEFYWDLVEIDDLTAAGIRLPDYEPRYDRKLSRKERRAANGFYSLTIPTESQPKWLRLLAETRQDGPIILQRAMVSLYRIVRDHYKENLHQSDWLLKYPEL